MDIKNKLIIKFPFLSLKFFSGLVFLEIVNKIFDYFIYPLVMYKLSFWNSYFILLFLALILNYSLLFLYDYLKKDIFGFEKIKEIKKQRSGIWKHIFKMGRISTILGLSFYDPFLATIYLRKPGFAFCKKDHFYIFLTTLIGHTIWLVLWSPIYLTF